MNLTVQAATKRTAQGALWAQLQHSLFSLRDIQHRELTGGLHFTGKGC